MKQGFRARWSLPLRLKVVILVLVALSASLASYVYVGNRLIIADKLSYIYDYNLSHLRVASEVAERRIEGVIKGVTILATSVNSNPKPVIRTGPLNEGGEFYSSGTEPISDSQLSALGKIYEMYARNEGVAAVQLLRPVSDDRFEAVVTLGDKASDIDAVSAKLGWNPKQFREHPTMVGPVVDGYLPVGIAAIDVRAKPVAALALINLGSGFFREIPIEIKTLLADRAGAKLFSNFGKDVSQADIGRLEASVLNGNLDSGVQDWQSAGRDYLVGYKRMMGRQLLVLTLIPREEAFSAARTLVKRSIFLGVSILFLAVGFALLFIRSITRRLREMWLATEKVSQGDFTVRVEEGGGVRDEVASLASSFNVMAQRIEELVESTAEKARMEQELQTAELVQETLMPSPSFKTQGVEISSFYDHATECGGDWWHYAEIGGKVYIWIADATGHGAPAALLTSACKSAVTLIERLSPMSPGQTLELLNKAIYETAKSRLMMTMFLGVLDKKTGAMVYSNAGHEHPYLIRTAGGKITKKSFEVLNKSPGKHLGSSADNVYQNGSIHMNPGDILVLFTDGLTDLMNESGQPLGRSAFIRGLCEVVSEHKETDEIIEKIRGKASDHRKGAELADDVTFLVCKYDVAQSATAGLPVAEGARGADPKASAA